MSQAAIIGHGILNPVAQNCHQFAKALQAGKQVLTKLEHVPIPHHKNLAGLINLESHEQSESLCYQYAIHVIQQALANLQFDLSTHTIGLFVATMSGESKLTETGYQDLINSSESTPTLQQAISNFPLGTLVNKIAHHFNLTGPSLSVSNACASGNIACGLAMDAIHANQCDLAIVLGVEVFKLSTLWGAERAGFIGTKLAPFAADRDGAILGEGAAAIVLSSTKTAENRKTYGWLTGFGCVCDKDAAAITLAEDGSGLIASMQQALDESGQDSQSLTYINTHAPGTKKIDAIECCAIKNIMGSNPILINSTKSITTHLAGASAITEIIATLIQMQQDFIHPNANLVAADPLLAIRPVLDKAIYQNTCFALSNACGGGGLNSTIAMTKNQPSSMSEPLPLEEFVITGYGSASNNDDQRLTFDSNHLHIRDRQDIFSYFPDELNHRYLNYSAQLAAVAAHIALNNMNFDLNKIYQQDRIAVIAGSTLGGSIESTRVMCDKLTSTPRKLKPSDSLDHGPHLAATLICRYYQFIGLTYTVIGSRNAGLQALESSLNSLRHKRADAVILTAFDNSDRLLKHINHPHCLYDSAGSLVIEKKSITTQKQKTFFATISKSASFYHRVDKNNDPLQKKIIQFIRSLPYQVDSIYFSANPTKASRLLYNLLQSIQNQLATPVLDMSDSTKSDDYLSTLPIFCIIDSINKKINSVVISMDRGGNFTLCAVSSG